MLLVLSPSLRSTCSALSALSLYGYGSERCWYIMWRSQVGLHVTEVQDDGLFSLLHFVPDDLTTDTKAHPSSAARTCRTPMWRTVDDVMLGEHIAWLVEVGFLPALKRSRLTYALQSAN
ncbi:uncharacterized protein PHACADRAFT_92107 [Phanerochaete carnosa HHB-10118-sp]|uniref:Uncharacterized protein n=1 Tax=Phanerochaete carnosa (strain HHB-10118-sp) TaxID=650164 RepID=K5WD48_PHACS|nr:uncharacterized protein PHACADRAFT_92107 [Phanerochaete carnosa HHB-10118-sp]EKM57205.1 hypothetical protein PHACADRAFT_92107 [Phanerochaete carnosa HHB-10118-sp]